MNRQQILQMGNIISQQTQLSEQLNNTEFIQQFRFQAESSRQYILTYKTESELIGRLNYLPEILPQCPKTTRLPIWSNKYEEIQLISACSQSVSKGQLIIAIDDEYLFNLKGQFISASIIAFCLAILFGLITGLMFSRRVLKRINGFNRVALDVESGQLSARMTVSKHNDEYDHMAIHINTMLNQLQLSFETIAGITDAIAHDLRTPLSHLRQQMESEIHNKLKHNLPSQQLQSMLEKLDEILFTFSAMLELTRLQHQKEQKNQYFKPVDLKKVIFDAVDLIEPLTEERKQIINIDSAVSISIQGDATLLFRAVYNLLENASKYAGNKAKITVLLTEYGYMISDNGPGICDSEKDKVFQRLYRIEKSRQIAGFGLGLTLVKAIIQLHGGKIYLLDNNPGLIVKVDFTSRLKK